MGDYTQLYESLVEKRPVAWEGLPDLDLYMDQVISYMKRQHIGLESGEALTSAMVNNYIKSGLLPRANGKKYTKEHIAYLTAICLLKQVFSINEVGDLLGAGMKDGGAESFYHQYAQILDEVMEELAEQLPREENDLEVYEILRLAIKSYGYKYLCQQMLAQLKEKSR